MDRLCTETRTLPKNIGNVPLNMSPEMLNKYVNRAMIQNDLFLTADSSLRVVIVHHLYKR